MSELRRAIVYTTTERYAVVVLTFMTTVVIARLLGPAEMGISILGSSFLAIAEMIRELGVNSYLVQQPQLTLDKIRSAFTVTLLITIVVSGLVFLLAGPVADFYGTKGLKQYLRIVAFAFLLGPFIAPINALLRRSMNFGITTCINVASAALGAITAVYLAWLGFSYMSFAWASLVSAASLALLGLYFRPEFSIFRPSLREWRNVVAFGAFDTASNILYSIGHDLPYLVFGRMLNTEAVGIFQRASMICYLPARMLFSGIAPITLPLLAEKARKGENLKETFIGILDYVTVLQWPSLALLALFAHPAVLVVLGERWMAAVAIVQCLALARMFWIPSSLINSVLIATGRVSQTLTVTAISVPVTVAVMSLVAMHGLEAVALSMFITMPFYLFVGLYFVRQQIHFEWYELAIASRKNALVTLSTIACPLVAVALSGHGLEVPVALAFICIPLGMAGWLFGLKVTNHPLLHELHRFRDVLTNAAAARLFKRPQGNHP
jgi:O-antigen/teichoic acid export membrane protein